MKSLLSKKAIRLLENNGYSYQQIKRSIVFKKAFDYVTIIVIAILTLIVSFPVFLINAFLGYLTLVIGFIAIIVKVRYYSKRMNFILDLNSGTFHFLNNEIELDNQSLSYASKIILNSRFKDEYASSFKTTNEEHRITIGLQLKSGSAFTCFEFSSDYKKPSDEILEIYQLIKRLIMWTKKKEIPNTTNISAS